jgi:CheY-like chemotaxis protein
MIESNRAEQSTILVVDDESANIDILNGILESDDIAR